MTTAPAVPNPATDHAGRLFREQLGQLLVVASGFLDRLLLTGLLVRAWDVETFEVWSACIAFSSLISLFELGFNLYFNNQLMIEMERGDREAMRKTYAVGNMLFATASLGGFALLVGAIGLVDPMGPEASTSTLVAAVVMCAANAAKIALCAVYALYRANRDYGRFAVLQGVSEILRIAFVAAVVVSGGGLVAAAIVSAIATTAVSVVFVLSDTRRRYYPNGLVFEWPASGSLRGIAGQSSLYMAQAVPIMLAVSLPVLVLQRMSLAPGLVAGFVLVRTLSNVARTPLQSAGIVFGQESGRRIAIRDLEGARRVTEGAGRLFAATSGLVSGLLLAGGEPLTRLWTGRGDLFDERLLAAATFPMILTPVAILIHNVLASHQAPVLPAIARWGQVAVTLVTWFALAETTGDLRMMVALSMGEVVGFAPVAYWAAAQVVPGLGVGFHLASLLRGLLCAAVAMFVTSAVIRIHPPSDPSSTVVDLLLIGACFLPVLWTAGLDREGRQHLRYQLSGRIRRRIGGRRSDRGSTE